MSWITSEAGKSQSVTRIDILHWCIESLGQSVIRGWVDSFIGLHLTDLTEKTNNPQEHPGL
jgi:hypothetical protein